MVEWSDQVRRPGDNEIVGWWRGLSLEEHNEVLDLAYDQVDEDDALSCIEMSIEEYLDKEEEDD